MEEFRKKLIKQRKFYFILAIMSAIFYIVVNIYNNSDLNSLDYKFLNGSRTGFIAGLFGISIANFISLGKCLKDDEKLKKRYIEQSDERTKDITIKASSATFTIMIILSAIAVFVSSFYNATVYYTILVSALASYIIYALSYLYYNKKY